MKLEYGWSCLILLSGSLGAFSACSDDDEGSPGYEGNACFANETCNKGLDCRSDVCVDLDGPENNEDPDDDDDDDDDDDGPTNVDLSDCWSCADNACESDSDACQDADGCKEVLECQLLCGSDAACLAECGLSGLTPDSVATLSSFYTCVSTSCLDECVNAVEVKIPEGNGGAGGSDDGKGGSDDGKGGSDDGKGGSDDGKGGSDDGKGGTGGESPADDVVFDGTGVWIDGANNDSGLQGAFYVLEDSYDMGVPVEDGLIHTDLTPDEFTEDTLSPCVSGTLAKVTDGVGGSCELNTDACEWTALWGGGIGLNLNESGGAASVRSAWDATANGVSGFSFSVSGNTGGAPLRFKAKMQGSDADFCIAVTSGENSVSFSDLSHNCYPDGVPSLTLDVTQLTQLEWQIVPDASEEYNVSNFCITSLDAF